jgi:D-alanine-D-alanine ligase
MCFSEDYYETKPRILGYKAKWDESSMEYQNTKRTFKFEDIDSGLIAELREIAKKCWKVFDLRGYARVDVRVGTDHLPRIIEINANPCIAPDSGFVAACYEAGLTNTEIIKRIINDAKQY